MADRRETFERELAPEPGRTALVVVDMQRGFLDPGEAMEVPPARETLAVLQTLLALFRAHRMQVAFTEFVYSEETPLLSFRDTRGLDEPGYDPAEDIAAFNNEAHVVLVTVKALDHAEENVVENLRAIRAAAPDFEPSRSTALPPAGSCPTGSPWVRA